MIFLLALTLVKTIRVGDSNASLTIGHSNTHGWIKFWRGSFSYISLEYAVYLKINVKNVGILQDFL